MSQTCAIVSIFHFAERTDFLVLPKAYFAGTQLEN